MPISKAGMKKIGLNSLRVMSNMEVFAKKDSWPAGKINERN